MRAPLPSLRVARAAVSLRSGAPAPVAMSLDALLPDVVAMPVVVQDAAVTLAVAVAATAFVKGVTAMTTFGWPSSLTRKLIHTGSGPAFLLSWALFSDMPMARLLAAIVPALQIVRLVLASRGRLGEDGEAMVRGISRTGSDKEVAGGPLVYAFVLLTACLLGWRTVPAAVAVCQMAVGDGLADIFGRRFGDTKWPFLESKSLAGSAAFVLGAFLASLGIIGFFHACGYTTVDVGDAALPVLAISFISAAVRRCSSKWPLPTCTHARLIHSPHLPTQLRWSSCPSETTTGRCRSSPPR